MVVLNRCIHTISFADGSYFKQDMGVHLRNACKEEEQDDKLP